MEYRPPAVGIHRPQLSHAERDADRDESAQNVGEHRTALPQYRAVSETIACFPVYRTYLAPGRPVSQEDREAIERAIAAAKRRNPGIEASVFNFLRDILLFQFPENLDDQAREEHTRFVLKFQQYTGPITAKGLEDTVFYIFNRLAALNEVGGEPSTSACRPKAFTSAAKSGKKNGRTHS